MDMTLFPQDMMTAHTQHVLCVQGNGKLHDLLVSTQSGLGQKHKWMSGDNTKRTLNDIMPLSVSSQ